MKRIECKSSVLDEVPEECPQTSVMRYRLDQNADWWIEVTATDRGIEVRSNGGRMAIQPISGNNVEIYLARRES